MPEFDYTGSPGRVVTSAFSVSESGEHVFRVPLWDIVAQRSATGGYPWYIEGDSSTVVYIKNVTDEERQYTLQLRYDGGVYALGVQTIGARHTAAFDIRAIRDQQVPDADGKTLPLDATSGQVNWSMRGTQNQVLIGRSEQVDLTKGVSSNYACQNCCPDSFDSGWVDPGGGFGFVGDWWNFQARELTANCYGSLNAAFNPWPSWDSANGNVCSCNGGQGIGQLPGLTTIQARWTAYEWGSFESGNPNECYERPIDVLAEAFCEILMAPAKVKVVVDQGGFPAACPSTGVYVRQMKVQVVDSTNADVTTAFSVKESFANLSTNTCGNGNPQSEGCAPADTGGTFLDSMTVSGNLCNSGISQSSGCGFTVDSTWSICSGTAQDAIWKSSRETRSNIVKVNGQSSSYSAGTILTP